VASARSQYASSGPNLFSSCFNSSRSALEACNSILEFTCSLSLSSIKMSPVSGYASWNAKAPIVVMENRGYERDKGEREVTAR